MASSERFESLLAKADAEAKRAVDKERPQRAPIHAQLASMWLQTATLEHAMLHSERQQREISALKSRVAVLEAKLGVVEFAPVPDVFAEEDDPPAVGF